MTNACSQCGVELAGDAALCAACSARPAVQPPAFPPEPFSSALLDSDRNLEGIGGWLILVAAGLALGPLMIFGRGLVGLIPVLLNPQVQPFLQSHPALHALILFEVATNLIFIAVLAGLNFLFYMRRRSFPGFMIGYLILQLVITLADVSLTHALMPVHPGSSSVSVARALVPTLISVPYLLNSRRVKMTFTR